MNVDTLQKGDTENDDDDDNNNHHHNIHLTETCSRVGVGKNLSQMFPIRNGLKQGDALSPLLFNFTLEYAIKRVQVKQRWLEIKWYASASGLCR